VYQRRYKSRRSSKPKMQCGMWLWNHDSEFASLQHPAMWQVALGWHAMEFAQTSAILEFDFDHITRDQPNSRFHGCDIFREIGLLPWKTPISVKFREINDFTWILMLLLSFMKVCRVLSTAFVRILLFATRHTSALSSWNLFTVLLTYIQSSVLT